MSHFLRQERERVDLKQKTIYEHCEVDRKTYSRWEAGTPIPSDKLAKLYELGFDIDQIVIGHKSPKKDLGTVKADSPKNDILFIDVPELSLHASAGHGAEILTEESDKSLIFKKEWINAHRLQNKDLVMIHAKGDSMEPSITCGDELLIDKNPMDRFVDGIYIIRIDKDLFVKRLRKRLTGAIDIISDNPAYPNETIDDSNSDLLHVIGKVVWIGRAV
ncbi:S24 family peptidase [Colwellia psychrerythraea]|uniref:Putative phage repressor n=1 Tax=Colwellia psychrerythraea TaxID=28229 RepID=A0A099KPN4_COLPS|nr:S24 family peptidase [Colwellia psychrerythraea]KGJ92140.1 putative phage repressor [Colwellia psychrerythraea]